MNYSDYDFEGLWFDTFRKVLQINSTLNGSGLDKSQLREVATSVFIAKVQKGLVCPGMSPDSLPEGSPAGNGHGRTDYTPATGNQIKTIKSLLTNQFVTAKEKAHIEEVLTDPEMDITAASEILDRFLGRTEKQNGRWVKVTTGVIAERKALSAAA